MTYIEDDNICIPEHVGQDFIMHHIYGKCKCNHIVISHEKYCSQCGVKLDWTSLREELHKEGFEF